jgi:hypothetical protein
MYGLTRSLRRVVAVALLLALATSAYAFTKSLSFNPNTAPVSLGYNTNTAGNSSFSVTLNNSAYTLNGSTPQNVDSVVLTLTYAGSTPQSVSVWVGSAGYTCPTPTTSPQTLTCSTSGLTASQLQAGGLIVRVAQ